MKLINVQVLNCLLRLSLLHIWMGKNMKTSSFSKAVCFELLYEDCGFWYVEFYGFVDRQMYQGVRGYLWSILRM